MQASEPLARAERDMLSRYSMEYVVANLDWLEAKLQPLQDKFVGAHARVLCCWVLLSLMRGVLSVFLSVGLVDGRAAADTCCLIARDKSSCTRITKQW